jgi:hypothetical protein
MTIHFNIIRQSSNRHLLTFQNKNFVRASKFSHAYCMPRPSHYSVFGGPNKLDELDKLPSCNIITHTGMMIKLYSTKLSSANM